MNRPDVKGREGILAVHTQEDPAVATTWTSARWRGRTSGFSGADLANLVNEAALNAARYNQKVVRMVDFEFAKDKVLMGAERRSMIISDEEKKVTAIHEAGHAVLAVHAAARRPDPQGHDHPARDGARPDDAAAGGREAQLLARLPERPLAILLGGRIAEEIMLGQITTGAGNDLERATEMARSMVCEWGMSDAMGPLTFGKKEEQIFLGREIAQRSDYSEDTALRIDQEVKRIVTESYQRALEVLQEHRAAWRGWRMRCCRARCSTPIRSTASSPASRWTSRRPPRLRRRRRSSTTGRARRRAPASCRRSAVRFRKNRVQRVHRFGGSRVTGSRVRNPGTPNLANS